VEVAMKLINRLFRVITKLAIIAALLITIAFIITSCGGGGGGGGGGSTAGGGVSGTGRSTGVITGFGSIFVNGIEFKTTSSAMNVNGDENATESDLKIGMKVNVEAVDNVASLVEYEPEVIGQVSNKGVNSFDVLGQTVKVNTQTKYCFDDEQINCTFSFAELSNDDFVEVSGYFDSTGNIIATLVKKEDQDPGQYQVKGFVSGLDTINKTFSLNNLAVDYSGISNPPGIAEDVLVEVKGTLNAPNELTATAAVVENTQAAPGTVISLEGIVTQFTSQSDFEVNGQPVLTNSQTQFEEGEPAQIALNVRIEVDGTVNNDGVLVAKVVEIEDDDIED